MTRNNPPRNQSQPAPFIQHHELTPNNSLEGTPSDPTISAIITAMQAISTQMAELSRERNERKLGSPSPHTSTPLRQGRALIPPPPPPATAAVPVTPIVPLTPLEKYEKMRKVWAGLQQDL
ncbi:unnamed protein product [Gordionus sp. m RMFG-2023]